MKPILANCEKERQLFENLLKDETEERILLIKGKSGAGKTTLLRTCLFVAKKQTQLCYISLNFKDNSLNIMEFLYQMGECIGWEHLKQFTHTIEEHSKQIASIDVNLKSNSLIGIKNQLQILLPSADTDNRKSALLELTKALFQDLKSFEHPLLFAFDTYEQCAQEVQSWVLQLLTEVSRNSHLRIVISGQKIPDSNNIQWGDCCHSLELKPICKAEDWLPVFLALNKKVPNSDISPLEILKVLCSNYQHEPNMLKTIIDRFPCCEEMS